MLSLREVKVFLITKELIFGFQIVDLKDHFSASLNRLLFHAEYLIYLLFFTNWFPKNTHV